MASTRAAKVDTHARINTTAHRFVARCGVLGAYARSEHAKLTKDTAGSPSWWARIDTQMTQICVGVTNGLAKDGLPALDFDLSAQDRPLLEQPVQVGQLLKALQAEATTLQREAMQNGLPQLAEEVRRQCLDPEGSRLTWAEDAWSRWYAGEQMPASVST